MKRIVYKKHLEDPNKLVTQRLRGNQNAVYVAEIDIVEMTYKVRNVLQRRIVRSNEIDKVKPPKHLNTLKNHVKAALKKMGIKFEVEVRFKKDELDIDDALKQLEEILNNEKNI